MKNPKKEYGILNFRRYFITKEEITIKNKKRKIYLFNDCILVVVDRFSDNSFFIKRFIDLNTIVYSLPYNNNDDDNSSNRLFFLFFIFITFFFFFYLFFLLFFFFIVLFI